MEYDDVHGQKVLPYKIVIFTTLFDFFQQIGVDHIFNGGPHYLSLSLFTLFSHINKHNLLIPS